MRFPRLFFAVLLGSSTSLAPAHEPALSRSWKLTSPAGPDTGESNLHTGPDGTVYLTYSGPGAQAEERALWLATLAPGAAAWSTPRSIVNTPLFMENWADFASLTVATDGTLWAQWYQERPAEERSGYEGWFARSSDGGATWSQPAALGHEFVSLAPLSGGRVLAVWLESTRDPSAPRVKRDPASPRPVQDPNAPYRPSMQLKARLLAPGGATLQDWLVDPDVCSCCQTTVARLPGDSVIVAYRGHTPAEIRDNLVARFDGAAWSPPVSLHDDGWQIAACPVNGPAADTQGPNVAIAWFTAAHGAARVQAKFSPDAGHTFGPALAIDLGRPIGRIDLVTLGDGSALVSWLEARTEQNAAGLYVRRIFPDGALSAPRLIADTSAVRASGFARLALRAGEDFPVVISWTEAVPADPADPKSTAATRVHTAGFAAATLGRAAATGTLVRPGPAIAVVRANLIQFLEVCTPDNNPSAAH